MEELFLGTTTWQYLLTAAPTCILFVIFISEASIFYFKIEVCQSSGSYAGEEAEM